MTDTPLLLLVDDDPADLALTISTLDELGSPVDVVTAADGVEALDYLHRADERRPSLILLDLNMPRKDGRELLRDIKEDAALRDIPVIVHSTSTAPGDVADAYRLHANSFVKKASQLEQFRSNMKSLTQYWLDTVRLPGLN